MSYFLDLFFANDEKQASPEKATEEEKDTKLKSKERQAQELGAVMGSAPRKGWLDWQFWKRSDNQGGPFNPFRKNNKSPGAFTVRKGVNDAVKETGKGEGSKDVARNDSAESVEKERTMRTTQNTSKNECANAKKTSASSADKDAPLVTYNTRSNGGKDVALNMRKIEALKNMKQQSDAQTQQMGTTATVEILEEKYTQKSRTQLAQVKRTETKGLMTFTKASTTASKKKTIVTKETKTLKAVRQQITTQKVQKQGTANLQVPPTTTITVQRQEVASNHNPEAKTVVGKTNVDRKPVETKRVDNRCDGKNMEVAKKTVVKKSEAAIQSTQRSPLQKPAVISQTNGARIEEKPSTLSTPGKTIAKATGGIQVGKKNASTTQVDKNKIGATNQAVQQNVTTTNTLTTVPPTNTPNPWLNVLTPQRSVPAASKPQNQGLQHQQKMAQQNVKTSKRPIATPAVRNGPKSSNPQRSNIQPAGPHVAQAPRLQNVTSQNAMSQNAVSQSVGPKSSKSTPQDPKVQNTVQQSPKQPLTQCPMTRNQVGATVAPNPYALHQQPPTKQEPQNANQKIPQNPSEIGPSLKRPYSEVASSQPSIQQTPSPQRIRPNGGSQQQSCAVPAKPRSTNRRKVPAFAKCAKPSAEAQPKHSEVVRQADPKEPDNTPKRKIVCSRDGREIVIDPNIPVIIPGTNPQGTKNISSDLAAEKKCPQQNTVAKTKVEAHAKPAQPVKPVMKDASTSTIVPNILVEAAVQVPEEEENAGDETQSLLVKRPWDTERVMKMQVLLDEKLVVIGRMKEVSRKQRDELKARKKRCSELENIIKESNMQGKPQLITQVNELTEIKNELLAEVTELTIELEKERTNVKGLKTELVEVREQLTAARKKAANPPGQ